MIDPVTIGVAFAGAQAAVKGIKEVLALGKDVSDISEKVVDFFNHQTVVEQAARTAQLAERKVTSGIDKKPKKSLNQLTAEAFDIVYKEKLLIKQQYEIYELLVWSGNGDLWDAMVKQRDLMRKQQKEEEAEELRLQFIREKQIKERKQLMADIGLCVLALFLFGMMFWGIIEFMIAEGMVARHARR